MIPSVDIRALEKAKRITDSTMSKLFVLWWNARARMFPQKYVCGIDITELGTCVVYLKKARNSWKILRVEYRDRED